MLADHVAGRRPVFHPSLACYWSEAADHPVRWGWGRNSCRYGRLPCVAASVDLLQPNAVDSSTPPGSAVGLSEVRIIHPSSVGMLGSAAPSIAATHANKLNRAYVAFYNRIPQEIRDQYPLTVPNP